jgi:pilus assembly protein Flp/PilA
MKYCVIGREDIADAVTKSGEVAPEYCEIKEAPVTQLNSNFYRFLTQEDGAAAAEYALILAIVGSAIAVAAITLGTAISTALNAAASCISNPGSGGANCGAAASPAG